MRIKPEQIAEHLAGGLKPVYLVTGDEPLIVLETAQAIREAARGAGFERLVFDADAKFDWDSLNLAGDSLSLFANRRLLDVRIPGGKPGREGGASLTRLASESLGQSGDVLLLTLPKLEKRTFSSAWVKALEKQGVVIQCWPVGVTELPGWLDRRMRSRGLEPEPAAARALAGRTEGNLLAAVQEIEKLLLVRGPGPVSAAEVEDLVADNARFDLFRMVDTALGGEAARALRMARSLRAEDAPLPLIGWALTKDIRLLYRLREALAGGGNLPKIMREQGVWESRRPLLDRALRRLSREQWRRALASCARLDKMIKGADGRDPWNEIDRILILLALAAEPAAVG